MLTETEARELLAKAADTIEVGPGEPILGAEQPTRPRWLLPVLAAATVAVVVVGAVAVLRNDTESSPPPVTGPTTPPVVEPGADGRMPSVFGYDKFAATDMLEGMGLVVTTEPVSGCVSEFRAVRTVPPIGTRIRPGDAVTLFATQHGPLDDCIDPLPDALAWTLLDFANGRGPAPGFAPEVIAYVNGDEWHLTADQAADLSYWQTGSPLDVLAAATRPPVPTTDWRPKPFLAVYEPDGFDVTCGDQELPAELAGRSSSWFRIGNVQESIGLNFGCVFANVYRTDGQIDAIVVRTEGILYLTEDAEPGPPNAAADPDGIGAAFLAFARGQSEIPPVADDVRLYLGNEYEKTISAADARDPGSWKVCALYAERSCPFSALATLRNFEAEPAVEDLLPRGCLTWGTEPVTDSGGTQVVVLSVPEPPMCAENFAVQIWSDDDGHITAVNLLLGSP